MSETRYQCLSTHGGAGYAPGTYVTAGGHAICGACGADCGPANYACLPREMRPGYWEEVAEAERCQVGRAAVGGGVVVLGLLIVIVGILSGWQWQWVIGMPLIAFGWSVVYAARRRSVVR